MKKKCFKCGFIKPLESFYKHPKMADGHLGKCKQCTKQDVAARVEQCSKDPAWLKKERERGRIKMARRRAAGLEKGNPIKRKQYFRKWCKLNPEKRRAQAVAARAQLKGLLRPAKKCHVCKKVCKTEKHHPDYSQPLKVQWLCSQCHGKTRIKN